MIYTLHNILDKEDLLEIRDRMDKFEEELGVIDYQVMENATSYYGLFNDLLLIVMNDIENALGKRLKPTYTYGRKYYAGAKLNRHLDRKSCEYTATLNIHNHCCDPWPIFVDDGQANHQVILNEGDICVYPGQTYYHWREPLESGIVYQVFLHFVEYGGNYDYKANDGNDTIVEPQRAAAEKKFILEQLTKGIKKPSED